MPCSRVDSPLSYGVGAKPKPADLAPIAKRAPHQALVEPHGRTRRRHALQLHELAQGTRRRRGGHRRLLLPFKCRNLPGDHRQGRLRTRKPCLHGGGERRTGPVPHARPPASMPARGQRRAPGRQPPAHLIGHPRLILRQAVRSRLTWRAASSVTVGTRTSLHTFFSPEQTRTSIRTRLSASSRSVFARRARRFTSMLAESTTRFADPQLRQRPMNPEPLASRFVTAHHRRLHRQPQPEPARPSTRSTAPRSPLATVRSHGSIPTPDVIANFQSCFPNSKATYSVGSFTLPGRVRVSVIIVSLWMSVR